MRAPSPPASPNPYAVANAQQLANIETATASVALANADEDTAEATVTYEQIEPITINTYQYDAAGELVGTTPREVARWKKTVTLKPAQQAIFDQQQTVATQMNTWALAQLDRLNVLQATPLTAEGLTSRTTAPDAVTLDTVAPTPGSLTMTIGSTDLTAHLTTTRDAIDARVQYQIGLDRDNMITMLTNQGIFAGSTAYTRALDTFDKASTDARLEAYLRAQAEQNRIIQLEAAVGDFKNRAVQQTFDMALAQKGFNNKAKLDQFNVAIARCQYFNEVRAREVQEAIALRTNSINEISALMNGGQVATPQFQAYSGAGVAATPVGDYVYRSHAADMSAWQQKTAYQQAMIGGAMSLVGSVGAAAMMPRTGPM